MNNFKFINLTHKPPVFKEKKEGDLIAYGEKNDYPDYLVDLCNRSPKHSAIINAKLRYMMGGGWTVDTKGDDIQKKAKAQHIINNANPFETLTEVTSKCEHDRLMFGGFAIEVIRSKAGDNVAAIYHVDFAKIRALVYAKDENGNPLYKYCYLPKWEQKFMKYETAKVQDGFKEWFAIWDRPNEVSTLYYYKPHRPVKNGELDVYPVPEYVSAIGYIDADSEIQNFHASNIKNNFWGGQIVTMSQVFATQEEQDRFVKDFKAQKTGTDNTGEVLFVFTNSNEQTVTATPLTPSDLDKQFAQLNEQVRAEIFAVHNVTTPLLFGIRSDTGFGGNKDEMQVGYELFYSTYIEPMQNVWQDVINYLYSFNGFGKVFNLKAVKPLPFQLSENALMQLLPIEELMRIAAEQMNIDLSEDIVQFSAEKKKDYWDSVGEYVEPERILSAYKVELDDKGNPKYTDEQFARHYFAEVLGVVLEKHEVDILSAIKENPKITPAELSEAFGLDLADIENTLAKLTENKLVVGEVGKDAKVSKKAAADIAEQDIVLKIEVKYRYSDKGAPALKGKSRPFCEARMAEAKAGKLYTRAEIEGAKFDLSPKSNGQDDNKSAWLYRGGWYHNPKTDETTPFCRHFWEAVTVKTKG